MLSIVRRCYDRIRGWRDEDTGPEGNFHLYCPEEGHVVATEYTSPDVHTIGDEDFTMIATYDCSCGDTHTWGWGPPAPILLEDGP